VRFGTRTPRCGASASFLAMGDVALSSPLPSQRAAQDEQDGTEAKDAGRLGRGKIGVFIGLKSR